MNRALAVPIFDVMPGPRSRTLPPAVRIEMSQVSSRLSCSRMNAGVWYGVCLVSSELGLVLFGLDDGTRPQQ